MPALLSKSCWLAVTPRLTSLCILEISKNTLKYTDNGTISSAFRSSVILIYASFMYDIVYIVVYLCSGCWGSGFIENKTGAIAKEEVRFGSARFSSGDDHHEDSQHAMKASC